jgi:hypothetical protein
MEHEYHGTAVHPVHLSLWERLMGKGRYYDPQLDYEQKLQEYRTQWETAMAESVEEEKKKEDLEADDTDEAVLEGALSWYFQHSYGKGGMMKPAAAEPVGTTTTTGFVGDEKAVE